MQRVPARGAAAERVMMRAAITWRACGGCREALPAAREEEMAGVIYVEKALGARERRFTARPMRGAPYYALRVIQSSVVEASR